MVSSKNSTVFGGVPKKHISFSIESWLFNKDPYDGLLESSHNRAVFHPLYTLNNQFFSLPIDFRPLKNTQNAPLGREYVPAFIPSKSTSHAGKFSIRHMDPMGHKTRRWFECFCYFNPKPHGNESS